jgi:hypothetical protein
MTDPRRKTPTLGTKQIEKITGMIDSKADEMAATVEKAKRQTLIRQVAGLFAIVGWLILLVADRFSAEAVAETGFWHFAEKQMPVLVALALLARRHWTEWAG